MTRKEEMLGYCGECHYKPFSIEACTAIKAIEWADQHPRKGLVDIDKVCKWLEENLSLYHTLWEGGWNSDAYNKNTEEEIIYDLRKSMLEEQ